MNIEEFKELNLWDRVVIQDYSEWNGRKGLIAHVYKDLNAVDVFCVQNPTTYYRVDIENCNLIRRDN